MAPQTEFQLDGIIPIIPTPFTANEEIDEGSLADLVEFALAAGACAVCLPAYASEYYKLSEDERFRVVELAAKQARGRIPVIGQVNYYSAAQGARAAASLQKLGASAIAAAVPRLFPVAEPDLARYFGRLLSAVDLPVIIQDFNPGGVSVSVQFVAELHNAYPNFRYVKLEEPMMGAKVEQIMQATGGEVGVLEGWGGAYMLELIPRGIRGVMPGLALTDILDFVWRAARGGEPGPAFDVFQSVLPQIVFSLQNLEFFHHAEKLLLEDRGILRQVTVRELRLTLQDRDLDHIRFLNREVLALLDRLGLPRNPKAAAVSRDADQNES